MARYPYISGHGNIAQAVMFLRKNFPAVVDANTIKRYGLAPKNESYVINALHFLGLIDEQSKRTETGHSVLSIHDETEFRHEFGKLVRAAYEDLFEQYGDEAWLLSKPKLINFFRTSDKTSDAIGARQANVYLVLAEIAGFVISDVPPEKQKTAIKPKAVTPNKSVPVEKKSGQPAADEKARVTGRETALTVRIEINLPANGSKETYDDIFRSINEHLFNAQ